MKAIKTLYADKDIADPYRTMRFAIKKKKEHFFLICTSKKSKFSVEIINSFDMRLDYYKNKDYLIIGISKTREDAVFLLCDIYKDILPDSPDNLKARFYEIYDREVKK